MQPALITLKNDDVVRLIKDGRSEDYITADIKHAPATRFDLSDGELLRMRRAGVSDRIFKTMREAQRGPHYGMSGRALGFIIAGALVPMALVLAIGLTHATAMR